MSSWTEAWRGRLRSVLDASQVITLLARLRLTLAIWSLFLVTLSTLKKNNLVLFDFDNSCAIIAIYRPIPSNFSRNASSCSFLHFIMLVSAECFIKLSPVKGVVEQNTVQPPGQSGWRDSSLRLALQRQGPALTHWDPAITGVGNYPVSSWCQY